MSKQRVLFAIVIIVVLFVVVPFLSKSSDQRLESESKLRNRAEKALPDGYQLRSFLPIGNMAEVRLYHDVAGERCHGFFYAKDVAGNDTFEISSCDFTPERVFIAGKPAK